MTDYFIIKGIYDVDGRYLTNHQNMTVTIFFLISPRHTTKAFRKVPTPGVLHTHDKETGDTQGAKLPMCY